MLREVSSIANYKIPLIDVRDCALAHLKALTIPEAKNKRIILYKDTMWIPQLAKWLRQDYGKFYDVPTSVISSSYVSFGSYFSKKMKVLDQLVDKDISF